MSNQIERLNYWVQQILPQVYDESLSYYELLNKVVLKLNEVIDQSNVYFEQDIETHVDAILTEWEASGRLADIINQALFEGKLDKSEFEAFKEEMLGATKYYKTPEDYGAKGDGLADDTSAIQQCLNENKITMFSDKIYRVKTTLVLPREHSIDGNHAELMVSSGWVESNLGASVPVNTILFIQGREPIFESELAMNGEFVRNLKIRGTGNFLTGMYLGATDKDAISQGTSVNYAVSGVHFENIHISKCAVGLYLSEAWGCYFTNVTTTYITHTAMRIIGQSVNNTFSGCFISTGGLGINALYINSALYNGQVRRPEGITFLGGFIGYADHGVRIETILACKFSSVVIDLNKVYAVIGLEMDDVIFDSCYIFCEGASIGLSTRVDQLTNNFVGFKSCNISNVVGTAMFVGSRQTGVTVSDCMLNGTITIEDASIANIKDNFWVEFDTTNPRIIKIGTGYARVNNNVFKGSGEPITTTNTTAS